MSADTTPTSTVPQFRIVSWNFRIASWNSSNSTLTDLYDFSVDKRIVQFFDIDDDGQLEALAFGGGYYDRNDDGQVVMIDDILPYSDMDDTGASQQAFMLNGKLHLLIISNYYNNNVEQGISLYALESGGDWVERTGNDNPFRDVIATGNRALSFVDIDRDGDLDLAVRDLNGRTGNQIDYYLQVTPDNWVKQAEPYVPNTVGGLHAHGDFDGDGDLDAVVGSLYYENNGSGFLAPKGFSGTGPVAYDFDNDGDLDLFYGNNPHAHDYYDGVNNLSVHENTLYDPNDAVKVIRHASKQIDMGNAQSNTINLDDYFSNTETGDLTYTIADGLDFATLNDNIITFSNYNKINLGVHSLQVTASNSTFSTKQAINIYVTNVKPLEFKQVTLGHQNTDLTALFSLSGGNITQFVDLDGDGQYEALDGQNLGDIHVRDYISASWTNTNGEFTGIDVGSDSRPQAIMLNGKWHLVVGNSTGNISLYVEESDGNWINKTGSDNPFSHVSISRNHAPIFADVDGDGDLDLTVRNGSNIDYYKQESPSQWIKQDDAYFSGLPSGHHALGDLDNDGDMDIIIGDRYFLVDDNQRIESSIGTQTTGVNGRPVTFDFDNDGDLDIFYNNSYIYENPLYSPGDAIKIIRLASKQIDMNNAQSNTINLDDYFSNTGTGDLTYTIADKPDFATLNDNIITFASGYRDDLGSHAIQIKASNGSFSTGQAININITNVYPLEFKQLTPDNLNTGLTALFSLSGGRVTQFVDLDEDGQYEALDGQNLGDIHVRDYISASWTNSNGEFSGIDVGSYSRPQAIMLDEKWHLVVGRSGGGVVLYVEESDGNWVEKTGDDNPFTHVSISRYNTPIFADIDGDGDLDLTVRNGNNIDYYKQESSSQWVKQDDAYFSEAPSGYYALGDFDNDGSMDIIIDNRHFQRNGNQWVESVGAQATDLNYVANHYYAGPVTFDFDNDGDLDVYYNSKDIYENLLYSPDDAVKIIRHASKQIDMNYTQSDTINLDDYFSNTETGELTYTIADKPNFATINDNIIIFASRDESVLGLHSLQVTASNGTFFIKQAININVTNVELPIFKQVTSDNVNSDLAALLNLSGSKITQFVDLDGDGQYEALDGQNSGDIHFRDYISDGWTNTNGEFAGIDIGSDSRPQAIMLNGKWHLVIGRSTGDVVLYAEESDGDWVEKTGSDNLFSHVSISAGYTPIFADVDSDGDLDFTVRNGSNIDYYKQESPSQWVKQDNAYFSGLPSGHHALGDLDNDGDMDIIIGNRSFHRNGGQWNELVRKQSTGLSYNSTPVTFDFDNDGDLDAFYNNNYIYENSLYNPDDAVKVIRHASKKIDVLDAQSNSINLDDYFFNTETGDLTYTITDKPNFATLNDNIITFASGYRDDLGSHAIQISASNGSFSTGQAININITNVDDLEFKRVTSDNPNIDLTALLSLSANSTTQFVDLNEDGQYEALHGYYRGNIYIRDYISGRWTNSNGEFNGIDVGSNSRPQAIMLEGKWHLVVGRSIGRSEGGVVLYVEESDGNWVKKTSSDNPFSHVSISAYYTPIFADTDGDGDLDLTVRNGNNIDYYKQESPSQWVKQDDAYFSGLPSGHHALGDFDNDGNMDIIIGDRHFQRIDNQWIESVGAQATGLTYSGIPITFDFDNDGDLDVFYYNNYIYENLLYSPDDAIKVIRHASKQIDMADAQSNTINLDDYFSNTETGDLTYTIADQPDFANLNDNIITFRSNNNDDLGVYSLQVFASNGTFPAKQAININITNIGNNLPVARILIAPEYDTQDSWVFDLNNLFTDPDGDELTFKAIDLPVFATQNEDMITFTTNNTATGTYTVTITATDALGNSTTAPYEFVIAEINDAPIAIDSEDTEFSLKEHGRAKRVDLYDFFYDEEDDDLIFTLSPVNAIEGFSYTDKGEGLYSFKTTREFDENIEVIITAREDEAPETDAASTTLTFTMNDRDKVNDTPAAATAALSDVVIEDAGFSFDVVSRFGFNDEESGMALTYTTSDLPEGFTFGADGVLSAEASATDHDALGASGTATITVTAGDGNSHTSSVLTLTLNQVNDTPTAQTARITDSIIQGAELDFDLVQRFGFADEEDDKLNLEIIGYNFYHKDYITNDRGALDNTHSTPFFIDGTELAGNLKNEYVGYYEVTFTASDSGQNNGGIDSEVKTVTSVLELEIVNKNDAPYIKPDKPSYDLSTYINGSVTIDLNKYFGDIDFMYNDSIGFTIMTGDSTTADLLARVQGISKNATLSTTDEHVFDVDARTDLNQVENLLTFAPSDSITGVLDFSVKAKDLDNEESDALNFKLTVSDEYRWSFGDDALVIDSASRTAEERATIVASIDEDTSFDRLAWQYQENSIVLQMVTLTDDGEVITDIATMNNIFGSFGPKNVLVKQGGQKIDELYLNFGYQGQTTPVNSVQAYAGISGTYKELLLPSQVTSDNVTVISGTNANAEYHIYSRELSTGSDVLTGNNGRDFFYILGEGNNDINGAAGSDTVIYVNSKNNLNITLDSGSHLSRGVYSDILTSIENITIVGSSGNINTLTGTTGANRIEGGDGGDTIIGNGGADQLIGGDGRDYITVTGSETLADGSESYRDNGNEHRDVLRFASDDTVTNVEVDYLLDAGGKFINFEEMDLAADGKNFIVKLDKDSIMEIFGGNVAVSGRANGATKDTIILRDFADWTRTEEDGIIKYTYGSEATITMQDDNVNVIEPITAVTHTINIDSTDNPDTPHSDFKFVDNDDAAQVVLDFNPLRGDVLLFKDADTVSPLQIKEELPQFLNSWWFISGQGLRLNSGNFGTSEASDIFIQPAEGVDISGIAPRFPGIPLNTDVWNDLVEVLGGADAFEFM